jgi:hypothetical protein
MTLNSIPPPPLMSPPPVVSKDIGGPRRSSHPLLLSQHWSELTPASAQRYISFCFKNGGKANVTVDAIEVLIKYCTIHFLKLINSYEFKFLFTSCAFPIGLSVLKRNLIGLSRSNRKLINFLSNELINLSLGRSVIGQSHRNQPAMISGPINIILDFTCDIFFLCQEKPCGFVRQILFHKGKDTFPK